MKDNTRGAPFPGKTSLIALCVALALGRILNPCGCNYLSGVGVGDITGPVADVNLMGYANPLQTAQGLHTRLFARAFVFAAGEDPSRRFVYVSMDACMASQLVTLRVVQRLQALYGDELYNTDNVAISGTHTHASPAGFLQYLLYDITSLGFVKQTFDAMVDGVVTAIRAAHDSLAPTRLSLASGDLEAASINRSPTAYLANPLEERSRYDADVDTDLTLVALTDAATGAGRGALGWFAVHCTSLNNTNRLVSGDNKAAAQLALERWAAEAEARAAELLQAEGAAGALSRDEPAAGAGRESAAASRAMSASTRLASGAMSPEALSAAAAEAAVLGGLGLDWGTATGSEGDGGTVFRLRSPGTQQQPAGSSVEQRAKLSGAQQPADGGASSGFLRFEPAFVAAVAQASVGDTSPNTQGAFCLDTGLPCDMATSTCNGRNELCHGRGPDWPDDRASAAVIGVRQFEGARQLYQAAAASGQGLLSGPVDFRSAYLDMTNISVRASQWTRAGRTCPPAMGMSFAAGTTDGPGAFDFTQGDTQGPPLWRLVRNLVLPPSAQQQACQAPKPILLDTGQITVPYLWQPRVTQISLLRLGQLLIACVPGEFTTMAGRRLKRALQQRFAASASGGRAEAEFVVVISGLTGTYSSYITTWEEYQVQRYEGASTLYGPHTLDAYIQEFLRLADAMIAGLPVTSDVKPPDLESRQISLLAPVVLDWVPPGADFGDVVEQPQPRYLAGQTARAVFRAACPRNNLRTNLTFMAVEVLVTEAAEEPVGSTTRDGSRRWWQWRTASAGAAQSAVDSRLSPCGAGDPPKGSGDRAVGRAGVWRAVYDDRDWLTRFHWHRPHKLSPESFATLMWEIPRGTPAGTYRLRYFGDARSLTGTISAFQGCSVAFEVAKADDDVASAGILADEGGKIISDA